MPYRITQYYLPPGRGDIPAVTPAEAGTRFVGPLRFQTKKIKNTCTCNNQQFGHSASFNADTTFEWVRVENRRFQLIWLHSVSQSKKTDSIVGPWALHNLHNLLLRHWKCHFSTRPHNFKLTAMYSSITEWDCISRVFFKDVYWHYVLFIAILCIDIPI